MSFDINGTPYICVPRKYPRRCYYLVNKVPKREVTLLSLQYIGSLLKPKDSTHHHRKLKLFMVLCQMTNVSELKSILNITLPNLSSQLFPLYGLLSKEVTWKSGLKVTFGHWPKSNRFGARSVILLLDQIRCHIKKKVTKGLKQKF